jgi:hypothetical protein
VICAKDGDVEPVIVALRHPPDVASSLNPTHADPSNHSRAVASCGSQSDAISEVGTEPAEMATS